MMMIRGATIALNSALSKWVSLENPNLHIHIFYLSFPSDQSEFFFSSSLAHPRGFTRYYPQFNVWQPDSLATKKQVECTWKGSKVEDKGQMCFPCSRKSNYWACLVLFFRMIIWFFKTKKQLVRVWFLRCGLFQNTGSDKYVAKNQILKNKKESCFLGVILCFKETPKNIKRLV